MRLLSDLRGVRSLNKSRAQNRPPSFLIKLCPAAYRPGRKETPPGCSSEVDGGEQGKGFGLTQERGLGWRWTRELSACQLCVCSFPI